MACFNRNTKEYKDLLQAYNSNMEVDSIIMAWQKANNTDLFPTVNQSKEFLNDSKIAFSLKQNAFTESLIGNLVEKRLIHKLGDSYYVNNTHPQSMFSNPKILDDNISKIKKYLEINNIPEASIEINETNKSARIKFLNNVFTPKDLLASSRSWDKNRSRHVVAHLMRLFPELSIKLVSASEAELYYNSLPQWQKANIKFKDVKSYYDPLTKQVVLIEGRVTDETAIEEMLHPFVDALFIDNIDLFNNLFNEAKLNFAELNQQINNSYSDKNGFDENYRKLEFVTQALTRHFKKEYEENPTKTFLERIEEFMKWFASIINNLHKYITGKNISTFKRDIDYYQGDQALMEQEEKFDVLDETTPAVKPEQTKKVKQKPVVLDISNINPSANLSDIAKLLNTSDIRFDSLATADAKVRFSLTPELQSTVDYALRQSNEIQQKIVKRLFHQAQSIKEEVGSLSAGESGPIIVLNEENHVYYNVLDTTETFTSTTESIKGKLSEDDLFNKKLNIDLGNDFDKILQGITSDKEIAEIFPQMKILTEEQAGKAYSMLRENLNEITRGGGVAIPQVVVHDQATRKAGSIDILVVMPDGKLRIVDLKTSKNSVKDMIKQKLKYDTDYELGDDSELKKAGIEKLSTRTQQAIQVNVYRRMLQNMGYEVDMGDMGASTFHIQVGVKGKDANQEFTGEFRSDEWISHPIGQSKLYVDILVPENRDLFSEEELEKLIDDSLDKAVIWNDELTDDEKIPEDSEFSDQYAEYEVVTQALETYRLGLINKLKAMEQIKSAIYMDRTKEQTQENILNALSAISIAMGEGPKARSALYTELTRDALKQIKNFATYVKNPNNFGKPEYITYVLNFNRFIKTFEGLYSIKSSKELNATQRTLIAELQIQLNELGSSNSKSEGLINEAIINYVKEQIKNWSSRDDLTEDVLDDLMKNARDIGFAELNTGDMATSGDTLLAVMDKIYKAKKQELLDNIERRNSTIRGLASRLQKLSPNKNTQELYEFMLEFDENGEFTGNYVRRLGKEYYKKQQDLRDKLYDESGNLMDYIDIDDSTIPKKEDLEYNIRLAKAKADYAAFWAAEKLGLDDKLQHGDFHKYTDEFIEERKKYQYYVAINGKPVWRRKAGVSDRAYQIFLAKYYNEVEYTYAVKDNNGNPTGYVKRDSTFYAVKPEHRVANDYNLKTGERLISKKYESIMNPTDALGVTQKEFYLAFIELYENQLLKKLPIGQRANMLGAVPIIKGKLFQDVKAKPNIVSKLWAKTTRSIDNLISETAQQRAVVVDEDGNLVDQLPIFYTGNVRIDSELKAIDAEIKVLNEKRKKNLISEEQYNREVPLLNGKLAMLRNKPSLGELNKDLGVALMKFSAMAEHYEAMSSVEDTFKAFIKVLEQRNYQPADPSVTLGIKKRGKFIPKGRRDSVEKNTIRRAKKWMSMVFYDNDQITKGFLEKVSDGLINYSSLSYVAFNPFGNFNNYALGRINNSIEALGQRFFSRPSYTRAELLFNKRAVPDLVNRLSSISSKKINKVDYDPERPGSKYEALVDLYRMMDNKSDVRETETGPEPIGKSWFRRAGDFGYVLQDAAEYNVQTKVGMAIIIDQNIMNKETGDIISLYDAHIFDSETKEAKLKDGYTTIVTLDRKNVDENGRPKILKEQEYNDQFRYMLRNKIREVNKQIHGNYAKDDRMVIQSYAVGRLAAQFHKWVAPAIKARFRREYFDENLGWMEGRYRSFWKFLKFSFGEIKKAQVDFSNYGDRFLENHGYTGDNSQRDQKAMDKLFNTYRVLGEIGIIMATLALNQILASLFSDDEDDTEFEKKMENFLRYQADRTYKELILFIPVVGSVQQYQMIKSPIASSKTLGEIGEALWLSVKTPAAYLIKDKDAFYSDSDYVYQRGVRKGELKLYKNWEDVIPILYSIKKYEDFLNLTNFYIK